MKTLSFNFCKMNKMNRMTEFLKYTELKSGEPVSPCRMVDTLEEESGVYWLWHDGLKGYYFYKTEQEIIKKAFELIEESGEKDAIIALGEWNWEDISIYFSDETGEMCYDGVRKLLFI